MGGASGKQTKPTVRMAVITGRSRVSERGVHQPTYLYSYRDSQGKKRTFRSKIYYEPDVDKVPESMGNYRPGESPQEIAALERRMRDMDNDNDNDTSQRGGRKPRNFKAIL